MPGEAQPPDSVSKSGAPVKQGDVLDGKYVVERVLGVGGMGVVVAARHAQLGSRVALKFLLPEAAADGNVCARFMREAQTVTRLTGEHVARVLDVGTLPTGAPYMVMEYLEGRDLGRILEERGALSVPDAIDYLVQACEAVAQAHAAGVVHRDLKPSNLFVTRGADGSPLIKVLDFGISKAMARGLEDSQLTNTSGFLGSPQYMSPEQIRSAKHVDMRSDIWSLGVILHELLTGRPPFDAQTAGAVLANIIGDSPPAPSALRPEIPRELDAVVARCLEKDVRRRYATVGELVRDIAAFGRPATVVAATKIQKILTQSGLGPDVEALTELAPQPEITGSHPAFAPAPAGAGAQTLGSWEAAHKGAPSKGLVLGMLAGGAFVVVLVVVGIGLAVRGSRGGDPEAKSVEPIVAAGAAATPAPETAPAPVVAPAVAPEVTDEPAEPAPSATVGAEDAGLRPVKRPVRGGGGSKGSDIEKLIKDRK
ncbi:MAG: serine/threonine protein kinase [Myxococcales bacterium]|nr:serine/threonine protein kinase [Myxococcales bacterium]